MSLLASLDKGIPLCKNLTPSLVQYAIIGAIAEEPALASVVAFSGGGQEFAEAGQNEEGVMLSVDSCHQVLCGWGGSDGSLARVQPLGGCEPVAA